MTRKTRQADMFSDGEDLPIFSGALVQAKQQAAAVPAAQAQASMIDMRPAFGATEPSYEVHMNKQAAAQNVVNALTGEYACACWAMRMEWKVMKDGDTFTLYNTGDWPQVKEVDNEVFFQCVPTLVTTDSSAIVNKLTEIYEVQS